MGRKAYDYMMAIKKDFEAFDTPVAVNWLPNFPSRFYRNHPFEDETDGSLVGVDVEMDSAFVVVSLAKKMYSFTQNGSLGAKKNVYSVLGEKYGFLEV